jgi:hypothetical protein
MKNDRKQGAGILGLGAAACVACCAGPILALLAGVAALGVVGTFIVGAGALVLTAVPIGAVVIVRRQRRAATCGATSGPVAVDAPGRRVTPDATTAEVPT